MYNGEPQFSQKCEVASAPEPPCVVKAFGVPEGKRKEGAGTIRFRLHNDPLLRLHRLQWQMHCGIVRFCWRTRGLRCGLTETMGSPEKAHLMFPQEQLPVVAILWVGVVVVR